MKVKANADTIVACRDTIVCLMQSDFEIKVCTPYGGHYFGPGVKDTVENTYVPFWAGTGKHTVTYKIGTLTCQVQVTIIDLAPAGSIIGNMLICGGETDELYQIPADTTARQYNWKITQWHDFKDSTSVPFNVIHFDDTFISGTLQASIINQCGEGSSSNMQIQVKPKPVPEIKNLSDTLSLVDNICRNQHLPYFASGGFDSCRWTIQGGNLAGLDTSRYVTVQWGNTSGNGVLNVNVFKSGCPGSASRNVMIGEGAAPDPASIWLFGDNMLVCSDSTANSYCWFQDGSVYTGYVSPSGRYILPEPLNKQSNYMVRTGSTPSCTSCYNDSDPFNFSKTGMVDHSKILMFSPNPAQDWIILKFNPNTDPEGSILIFNQYGILVQEKNITSGDFQVDVSSLPEGLYYILYIGTTGTKLTSKLVKS
jgi:hypothetical protein